jgi:hypothetical protein
VRQALAQFVMMKKGLGMEQQLDMAPVMKHTIAVA